MGTIGGNTLPFNFDLSQCRIQAGEVGDIPIVVGIKDCPTYLNLVTNGSFFYGNDNSFQSDLPLSCNSCSSSSYCVGNQFSAKCNSWPANTWDKTLNTVNGNYMLIDGNPGGPSTVWRDTVYVCDKEIYTFSFWVKSIYPDAFTLGLMVNNNTVPIYTTAPAISGPAVWKQYSTTWQSTLTGHIQIGIRQLTGGHKRDFGIDDINFGYCCKCFPYK